MVRIRRPDVPDTVSLFIALLVALVPARVTAAASVPHPPCGMERLAYPPPGTPPSIQLWHGGDLERAEWKPAQCLGWPASSPSRIVLVVTGSFRFNGSSSDLLAHSGAISTLLRVRYWSVTDKAWRPLVIDASALSGSDRANRRADFLPSDMASGNLLYYWEDDSRSGEVVHSMKVREHTPARIVIETENITPVRSFMMTLFPPGALQSVKIVERIAPGVWGVYLISRMADTSSVLAAGLEASYINRAIALYRHTAGIPTDLEPPAAP